MGSLRRLVLDRYTSAELPPADRHEAWANRGWPSLAPAFVTIPIEPFDIASESLSLGDLVIRYTSISAQRWERDASMLRSHDPDALTVAITLTGEARGRMGGSDFRSGPGSIQLCDLSQTSSHVSSASRSILLSVPRVLATASGLDVAGLHGRVLQSAAGAMLASHLLRLREAVAEFAEVDSARLARTVIDLLVLAVDASGHDLPAAGGARAGNAALLARDLIDTRLESPSLTIVSLCRQLGISRTTLHRLFEAEGGVQAHIRNRRLELARAALIDPSNIERIGAIAERLCFSDTAHLSRLFRTRFGQSPSEFRSNSST